MTERDQAARRSLKPSAEIDRANTEELKTIVDRFGWIRISVFGEEASRQAWLLVQHADQDVAFQKRILAQLDSLSRNGEALRRHYAYLYDRVMLKEGAPEGSDVFELGEGARQRYGTQGACNGGRWEPFPLESPADVDRWRGEAGLPLLAEYQREMSCP